MEPIRGTVASSSNEAGISYATSTFFLYGNNAIAVVGQKAEGKAAMAQDITGAVYDVHGESASKAAGAAQRFFQEASATT